MITAKYVMSAVRLLPPMLEFGGGDDDFQVSDEDINIGISMKKGNTELKEAIDSVLTKMTKDDFSAMMDEAISVQPLAN